MLLSLGGCAENSQESFLRTLDDYRRGLRWSSADTVASHLPAEQRASFVARHRRAGDIRVTDCQVESLRLEKEGRVKATLRVDWYSLRSGRVHKTLLRQIWKRSGGRWMLTEQRWQGGAPFPFS